MDTFATAQVYVMLSWVCSLDQILILNEFEETKMYPDVRAVLELERLNKISMNQNTRNWEKDNDAVIKVSSLNFRSLIKHHNNISTDDILLKSDII